MSNRELLDAGTPTPLNPPEVTTDLLNYANAFAGLVGTEIAPVNFGTFFQLSARIEAGVAVAGNQATVGPGSVLAVEATTGAATGPKTIVLTAGGLVADAVRVEPQSDGTVLLTFFGADAVTVTSVYLLAPPTELQSHLDEEIIAP